MIVNFGNNRAFPTKYLLSHHKIHINSFILKDCEQKSEDLNSEIFSLPVSQINAKKFTTFSP